MACPCTKCKYQIYRKRKICQDHVRKYDTFPEEHVRNLRLDSGYAEIGEASTRATATVVDIRLDVRRRSGERIEEDNQGMFVENAMDDMLDTFYGGNSSDNADMNVDEGADGTTIDHNSPHIETEEDRMQKLARMQLFDGATIFVLRALLAILNLQSIFGWSDKSVDALLRLVC